MMISRVNTLVEQKLLGLADPYRFLAPLLVMVSQSWGPITWCENIILLFRSLILFSVRSVLLVSMMNVLEVG